jgi:hypothetical protein
LQAFVIRLLLFTLAYFLLCLYFLLLLNFLLCLYFVLTSYFVFTYFILLTSYFARASARSALSKLNNYGMIKPFSFL